MKMPSKRMLLPMCALAVVAAGSYGVTQVSAASDPASGQTSIVQKLADTFHLDKSKVQAVFDEQHKQGEANREKAYEDRLAKAVTDGKLTADQKTKILDEHNKLKSELDAAMKTDTAADKTARKTAMNKIRAEAEQWAKDNNIDAKWLMPAGGPGMHGHGMGGMRGHHGPDTDGDADDAPTTSPDASPAA